MGKEFYNTHFQKPMKRHDIHLSSTFNSMKASICERYNRIKEKMWEQFTFEGNYEWQNYILGRDFNYNDSEL